MRITLCPFFRGNINLRDLNLEVVHAPIKDHPKIEDNRAHTHVQGIDTEKRVKLLDLIKWEIKPKVLVNL